MKVFSFFQIFINISHPESYSIPSILFHIVMYLFKIPIYYFL